MKTRQNSALKRADRIPVDISVRIVSVLQSAEATLANLTEDGALIEGTTLPRGAQFQIEYQGQIVYGLVMWAEHDRFGARFPFPLHDGPLYARLEHARMDHEMRTSRATSDTFVLPDMQQMPPLLRRPATAFGRRGL